MNKLLAALTALCLATAAHAFDNRELMIEIGRACDLGPVILTRFVRHAFGEGGEPVFDFDAFEKVVATSVATRTSLFGWTNRIIARMRRQRCGLRSA